MPSPPDELELLVWLPKRRPSDGCTSTHPWPLNAIWIVSPELRPIRSFILKSVFSEVETPDDQVIAAWASAKVGAEATSSSKAVQDGNADMSYVSPGVFSLGVEAGIDLVSVFQMGAYDVFDIALESFLPFQFFSRNIFENIVEFRHQLSGTLHALIRICRPAP